MSIRKLALVKFDFDSMPKEYHKNFEKFRDKVLIFFGEIPNMEGHGIFIDSSNTHEFFIGYHIDEFVELSEEEL